VVDSGPTADYFDQWYADIDASPVRRAAFAEPLGLPPEIDPSNLVPLSGLEELSARLAVPTGGVLVDLACGRGGPGMWLARAAGCRLIGVDFSPVVVAQAAQRRALFGLEQRASFVVGDLTSTGLDAAIADAVVCIDAFFFASDGAAASRELARLLKPGARVAMTGWEAVDRDDPQVHERLRNFSLARVFADAALVDVSVEERPDWYEAERLLWEQCLQIDAPDDPAIASMQEEARQTLPTMTKRKRVLATATAPTP
jgi:SAM-dependent methyltransferase